MIVFLISKYFLRLIIGIKSQFPEFFKQGFVLKRLLFDTTTNSRTSDNSNCVSFLSDFTPTFHSFKVAYTVLRAVSGNSRDGTCFKLDKQTLRRKSNCSKSLSPTLLLLERIINNDSNLVFTLPPCTYVTVVTVLVNPGFH